MSTIETLPGFRDLRPVGSGAMGEVYEAVEDGPLGRRVAIKLLKLGMDSEVNVARFESERQSLGLMSHDGIPRVLASGTSLRGRPYIVMEWVEGEPITEFCQRGGLGIEDRMRLLRQVCAAVQHAHQKGVIHRDLKPTNVLVTTRDGEPVAKVIDFGIALAIDEPADDEAIEGRVASFAGTLEYMSPEQLRGDAALVDTRADVYALGALGYELVSGETPFSSRGIGQLSLAERLQRIGADHPLSPSALGQSDRSRGQAASDAPPPPPASLRRDLDAVLLKALAPDPRVRYSSPSSFADDLGRLFTNEPVSAHPPSEIYRLRKFVRRHRGPVAACVVAIVALVAGSAAATVGLFRANREQRAAIEQAQLATSVSDFLVGLFSVTGSLSEEPSRVTARELLDHGYRGVISGFQQQPETRSLFLHSIGSVYSALGLNRDAAAALGDALRERTSRLGPDHPLVAESALRLSNAVMLNGSYPAADSLAHEALRIRSAAFSETSMEVAEARMGIAGLRFYQGRYAEGEMESRRAVDLLRALHGNHDLLLSRALYRLGLSIWGQGRYEEAVIVLEECLRVQREILPDVDPDLGLTLVGLGLNFTMAERYQEGEPYVLEAISVLSQVLGSDEVRVGVTRNLLADILASTGRLADAELEYEAALAIIVDAVGGDHFYVAQCLTGYAALLYDLGRWRNAEQTGRRAIEIYRTRVPPDHWQRAEAEMSVGAALGKLGQVREGEELLLQSYEVLREWQESSVWVARALERLVEFYTDRGRTAESARYRALLAQRS